MALTLDVCRCTISRATAPIRTPEFKLGGLPVFVADDEWPTCRNCGKQMDFLAQLPLRSPLRLSRTYDMAYVFMCPVPCDEKGWLECGTFEPDSGAFSERDWLGCRTAEPGSGANAVLLQKDSGAVIIPDGTPRYPDYAVTLERAKEPWVDTTSDDVDEETADMVSIETKLGGVPLWLQCNETPVCPECGGPTEFVAQLDAKPDGPLPAYTTESEDEEYKFFDFGDVGLGYVFLCERECGPNGAAFLWQC